MSKDSTQNEDAGWRNNVREEVVMMWTPLRRVMFVTNVREGSGFGKSGIEPSSSTAKELTYLANYDTYVIGK